MRDDAMYKFVDSVNEANIKNWEIVTAISSHLYNNDNQFNIIKDGTAFNFSPNRYTNQFPGKILVRSCAFAEIHEVRFGGDFKQINDFIKAFGLNVSDDQTKILVNIKGTNYNLKPATGDYLVFPELSEDEIAKLSPEEKESYDKSLKDFNEHKHGFQGPAQITI